MTSLAKRWASGARLATSAGEFHGLRHQVGGGHDAVDEADAERVLGVDAPAREDDFHGIAEAHDLRQAHAAAVARVEAPVHVLMGELRVGRAEADVAGLGELQPAGDRVAVDRRDDRLVDLKPSGDAAEAGPSVKRVRNSGAGRPA